MEIINISGEIGWEVLPEDVRRELDKAAGKDIDVHIASPGGYVFDGIEIFNAIRDYKRKYPDAQMMATIKGIAASMASYIAVNPVFDLVAIEDNAVFMIHNPSVFSGGDQNDHTKAAEVLTGITEILSKAYSDKTGNTKDEIKSLMDSETWFFGQAIIDAGFADEIIITENEKDKSQAMATAKVAFSALSEKLKIPKDDFGKIAAMIKPNITGLQSDPVQNIPAMREQTEDLTMSLKDLLAANPAAQIEFDNHVKNEKDAGFNEGKESLQAAITAASIYLKPDAAYPATIKAIAVDVLEGTKTVEALQTTVSAFDALKEAQNSGAAADETEAVGDTPAEQPPVLSENGEIKNELDFNSQLAHAKKLTGREV